MAGRSSFIIFHVIHPQNNTGVKNMMVARIDHRILLPSQMTLIQQKKGSSYWTQLIKNNNISTNLGGDYVVFFHAIDRDWVQPAEKIRRYRRSEEKDVQWKILVDA